MIDHRSFLFIPLSILLLSALPAGAADDSAAFRALHEKEWAFRKAEFPGLGREDGDAEPVERLTHVSEADQVRRYEFWKQIRAELDGLSCERLTREECIDFRMFRRQMDQFVADYETRAYLIPFNSDWAFWVGWARMADRSNFSSEQDYAAYLSRLEELPLVMDEYIALMRTGLETGMTQPRVIMDGRDVSIRAQVVDPRIAYE